MLLTIVMAAVDSAATAVKKVASGGRESDRALIEAFRAGDEQAFSRFVRKHWGSMLRVARGFLGNETIASEVVQETWETVIVELEKFRGDAALTTWIYRILINRAKRVGKREARTIPFSGLGRSGDDEDRNDPMDDFTWYGRWKSPVHGWRLIDPQNEAINKQGLEIMARELEQLPEAQRIVVTLRDLEGVESAEVCDLLSISEANQRVLLHRGRTRIRKALEAAESELDV